MSSTMPEKTPSIPVQQNPISTLNEPNFSQQQPPIIQKKWTSNTDGTDTWYVSSDGESAWTLPEGAILEKV